MHSKALQRQSMQEQGHPFMLACLPALEGDVNGGGDSIGILGIVLGSAVREPANMVQSQGLQVVSGSGFF